MRLSVPVPSIDRGRDAHSMWNGVSAKQSSDTIPNSSYPVRASSTNAKTGRPRDASTPQVEERQEATIGEQQKTDDEEYRILYDEIHRIDQIHRSGRADLIGTISLTSTFNKDAEILPSMHEKIMRLIKAMIPNSTLQQKDSFIRDLFDMGIRVGQNSPSRSQTMQRESHHVTADELTFGDSTTNVESLERVSTTPTYDYYDDGSKTYSYYDDGSNSIIENPEQKESEDQSIIRLSTNSSDAVDARWEQLRHKALTENNSDASTGPHSLSTAMEVELMEECVETGMGPLEGCHPTTNGERGSVHHGKLTQCTSGTSGSTSSHPLIMNSMELYETETEETTNKPKRPGQADDSSDHQPTQQRYIYPDSFSIDRDSNSIIADDDYDMDMSNIPSFDEGTARRRNKAIEAGNDLPQGSEFFDASEPTKLNPCEQPEIKTVTNKPPASFDFKRGISPGMGNREAAPEKGAETSDDGYPKIEVTLVSSSESESGVPLTTSTTSENVDENANNCSIVDESIGDSDIIEEDELGTSKDITTDDDGTESETENGGIGITATHQLTKLIHVKSSLTIGTDFNSPKNDDEMNEKNASPTTPKKQVYSFFKSVDLSVGETDGESFCTQTQQSEAQITPSWRLDPSQSHSDIELQILGVETDETTTYFVHKHMIAVGPRSSGYMNDAFRSENASTFQVVLDEKTSSLIPKILDFMYCHENDIEITTENSVALRQLGKMLKIVPLEVKASNFILKDLGVSNNLSQYVTDGCYFNDEEVMKGVVEKCSTNIETIPITDRLWIAMEPEIFLRIVSSPYLDRARLSKHLSLLLKEYLELHQYEIDIQLFSTLTSEKIIPVVDRDAAMPLIELCQFYDSKECEVLQKRCAYTVACYWKITPKTDRQRLFSLLRNLPSSLTVDFLEIVESGKGTQDKLKNQMEQNPGSSEEVVPKPEPLTIHDFCGMIPSEDFKKQDLSWRLDPEKSYSDWKLHVKHLNEEEEVQVYNVHRHVLAVGKAKGSFFTQNFDSKKDEKTSEGEKRCTTIVLDCEAASVVPTVLDFMYSAGKKLEISNEYSVPLHYVARVLGISTLTENVIDFIGRNLSVANVVDYIIDAGYYKDTKTLSMATKLCARDITSIRIDSEILNDIQSDVFEKIVSCDEIDETARSHINILITKYFSLHDLDGKVTEKLLKRVALDRIDQHSALTLLKLLSCSKNYDGIEIFDKMKQICAHAVTENWFHLTSDSTQRQEIFSIFPSLDSNILTVMFDSVDRKHRMERMGSTVQQDELVKMYQQQAEEAERLRVKDVSILQRELEERTAKMLDLQKALEGKLDQVDKALNRRTARSNAALTSAPTPRNLKRLSEEMIMELVSEHNLPSSPRSERLDVTETDKYSDVDLDWYQDDDTDRERRESILNKKRNDEGSRQNAENNTNKGDEEKQKQQSNTNDEQSIFTSEQQPTKGLINCC